MCDTGGQLTERDRVAKTTRWKMETERLTPIAEAAKGTRRSESSIRRGLKIGEIQGVKLGRDWLLPKAEVNRLAKEFPLESEALG